MPKPKRPIANKVEGCWEKNAETRGKLRGPMTLMLRSHVGEAKAKIEGRNEVFELSCTGMGGPGAPIVRCERTGIWFTLSWEDIITMAIDAGVTREHLDMKGK